MGKWAASMRLMEWSCSQFSRKSAAFLWGYFCPKTIPATPITSSISGNDTTSSDDTHTSVIQGEVLPDAAQIEQIFTRYTSDQMDDDEENHADNEEDSGGGADDDSLTDNRFPIGYTSPTIERVPDGADQLIATQAMQTQEISSFGIMV